MPTPVRCALRCLQASPLGPAQLRGVAATAASRRPSRWDLPTEAVEAPKSRFKLAEPDEFDQKKSIRLDKVTSEMVNDLWPPPSLVDPSIKYPWKREEEPMAPNAVHRPLWLADQSQVGLEDVGRFVKLKRDDLLELLPEGPCGEFARDLTMVPSRKRPVGLMLRKPAVELMMQLSQLRDATDYKGIGRIRKSGFFLDGRRGSGKSQVLNLVAMWARRNGWMVILEPTAGRYRTEIADIKRSNSGVYIQNEFAQQFLEATSIANREKFMEIPVDMSVYGRCAIDGEDVAAARKLYNPLIEKAVEQEVDAQGLSEEDRLRKIFQYRQQVRIPSMVEQLPNPMKLWDIVEFGLDNEAYATQAVAELFAQLKRQTTHPLLVIVDQWNECFPVSQYVSIRYDNTRFHGYIPAYHLTMPRALHRWDGHQYQRGLKICATSWMRYTRRDYKPELLGVKDEQVRTVRNFSQQEFASFVMYLRLMNVLHHFPKEDLEYYYMLTQGNGFQARKLLATLY